MKKALSFLLVLLMLTSLFPMAAFAVVTGLQGEGTSASPYLIHDLDELKWFRDDVNGGNTYSGKYIKLTADIDLGNQEWTPIGGHPTKEVHFLGNFDGGGNTIRNLSIEQEMADSKEANRLGLFGYGGSGSSVSNLTVENVSITGGYYLGAIVGNAFLCNITNCHVTGSVEITGVCDVGGITGYGYGKLESCTVTADAGSSLYSDKPFVGGIIGYRCEDTHPIKDCSVKNLSVSSGSRGAGGIAGGLQYGVDIDNCTVLDCEVSAVTSGVGLLAGSCLGTSSSPCEILDYEVTGSSASLDGEETELLYGTYGSSPAVTNLKAQVGTVGYTDLDEALDAAASSGKTLTLLADVPADKDLSNGGTTQVQMNSNGFTLPEAPAGLPDGWHSVVLDGVGYVGPHEGNLVDQLAGTCTEPGHTGRTVCKYCGEEMDAGETTELDPDNHDYGDWVIDRAAGVKTRTCSRCQDVDTQRLPSYDYLIFADDDKDPAVSLTPNGSTAENGGSESANHGSGQQNDANPNTSDPGLLGAAAVLVLSGAGALLLKKKRG